MIPVRAVSWVIAMSRAMSRTILRAVMSATVLAAATAGAAPRDSASSTPESAAAGPSDLPDQVSAIQAVLTRLQRTTVTGYVQARAAYEEDAAPTNTFLVRRARLNLRHSITNGRFALSFDGGQNTVTVKDAYFDWLATKDQGQRKGLTLRAGQFFRPFSYEIERGSPEREFMERPAAWIALFPGYRDVGADLSYGVTPSLLVNAAVVNGGGSSIATLPFRDPDAHKDVIGRVRYSLFSPRIELAASGYWGDQTIPGTPATPAQLGYVDANGNGVMDAGEATVVSVPAKAATPELTGDRNRWGFGTIVSDIAGGTLRAEVLWADDFTNNLGTGPSRKVANVFGWYAAYVRAIAGPISGGFRYDRYDPDTDDAVRLGGDGEIDTYTLIALAQLGENLRWTLQWEHLRLWVYDGAAVDSDLRDRNLFTMQGQVKF